jgi:hypothetical protein
MAYIDNAPKGGLNIRPLVIVTHELAFIVLVQIKHALLKGEPKVLLHYIPWRQAGHLPIFNDAFLAFDFRVSFTAKVSMACVKHRA